MRAFAIVTAMSVGLLTATTQARPPAGQEATTPAPVGQTAPAPPPAPQPPRPFPEGAKIAFINIQRIAAESAEGKSSSSKVQALTQKKTTELGERTKQLQATQQKLQQGGSVLSDTAREQLEKEIERMQRDLQRAQQDAQTEIQDLQQDLQQEFQRKLLPVIQQIAVDKQLQVLFSQADSGIVWADGGLDLTNDVIQRFDQSAVASPSAAPAEPPADPAAAARPPE